MESIDFARLSFSLVLSFCADAEDGHYHGISRVHQDRDIFDDACSTGFLAILKPKGRSTSLSFSIVTSNSQTQPSIHNPAKREQRDEQKAPQDDRIQHNAGNTGVVFK